MEKEFIPYEQALALKELGFDEPCFGTWRKHACNGNPFEYNIDFHTKVQLDHKLCPKNSEYVNDWISASTFSQAFRWFREKYGIFSSIWCFETEQKFFIEFGFGIQKFEVSDKENTELECLKKLIEIVKRKIVW